MFANLVVLEAALVDMALVASATGYATLEVVAACIVAGELAVDEPVVGASGRAAGDNSLRNTAVVIVTADIAIDSVVDTVVDADVDKLVNLCCKEFDGCSIKVIQMNCLPNFTASSATNAGQYLYC